MNDGRPARRDDQGEQPTLEHRDRVISSIVDSLLERQRRLGAGVEGPFGFTDWSDPALSRPTDPGRVMLVCGSRRRCARLSFWLARTGYDLDPRPDLASAVEAVAATRPAVVVVPWHLKAGKGRRAVEVIQEADPGYKPLIVALCRNVRAARAAIDARVDDVVLRPFDPRILAARVENVIASSRCRLEINELREQLRSTRRSTEAPVTEQRRRGTPDDLTGLPSLGAFERALRGALAAGASVRRRTAVILFDIDRFRNLNHTLGRARANVVLQAFAQRLVRALSPDRFDSADETGTISSMAARMTGDQFAILLSGIAEGFDIGALVERIRRDLTEDYDVPGEDRVHLTVSIGVSVAPDDGINAQELMQYAEYALGESTDVGGGVVRFYGKSSSPWTERHTRLANLVVGALARGELSICYQPIVAADSGRIVAAEALLRWHSPELGAVPPTEFVPIAEERGLMGRIGEWVLDESCRLLRRWLDEGVRPIRLAVNVSIGQLVQDRFSQKVRSILLEHRIDPPLLELEISERGTLRDDPTIIEQLHELRRLGCRLAIDDFGTGNSAVAYLKRFPLTTVKIDRSFVAGVVDSTEDAGITTAITAMAHQLQLTVVAEGVETEAQRRFLRRCECGELQGYLFSRPVEPTRFRELLNRPLGVDGPPTD
jgi:diguanylate cyclase (GGDEF)-like protein